MRVIVDFAMDVDVIDCPKIVVNNLEAYRVQFAEWFYDKNNDHRYWQYIDGEQSLRSFRSEVFVEWLNNYILYSCKEKAKLLIRGVGCDGLMFKVIHPNDVYTEMYDKIRDYRRWIMAKDSNGISKEDQYWLKYGERKYSGYALKEWLNEDILKEIYKYIIP